MNDGLAVYEQAHVAIVAYQRALALHEDAVAHLLADNALLRAEVDFLRAQIR